ncbi:MAG: hypothetical protein WCC03_12510, partial [Candidatus Acidiferrales bacterium]
SLLLRSGDQVCPQSGPIATGNFSVNVVDSPSPGCIGSTKYEGGKNEIAAKTGGEKIHAIQVEGDGPGLASAQQRALYSNLSANQARRYIRDNTSSTGLAANR